MDPVAPSMRNFEVDLENGCSVSGVDYSSQETLLNAKKPAKPVLAKICSWFIDGLIRSYDRASLGENMSNGNGVSGQEVIVKENKDDEGKKAEKEKRKKSSNKKPPRPPKPPRGPSLDSADLKLIKEISELVMLKRARIERMKALKKMKDAKQSSSNSNLFVFIFTLLFSLVIFQGMFSGGIITLRASSLPNVPSEGGLNSVQFSGNPSASDPSVPTPSFPNTVKQVKGSEPQQKLQIIAS